MTSVSKDNENIYNSPLECRVILLERDYERIEKKVDNLSDRVDRFSDKMERDFRLTFGALIAVALGLATMMAKGFHWL